ncbi:MAG TPA: hypothetical protein VGR19_01180 [Allosphingosinicella sp.]|nr:hypothetical protein [Allosphingosinicella sp.]
MKSLISEFSYGFALTHELVFALGTLTAAPIFPSLVEEGKPGGGYDLKLESPGVPLFLQFKRSECMQRRTAREIAAGANLDVPFYRMEITAKADSDQHEMLLELDQQPNFVFYAAPMFHQKPEFDDAFLSGRVRQRSFYVRPRSIGSFPERPHHVSFDGSVCVVMSEPKAIQGFGASELEGLLEGQLAEDKRALRTKVPEALQQAEAARARARERTRGARPAEIGKILKGPLVRDADRIPTIEAFQQRQEEAIPAAPVPAPTEDPDLAALHRLADIGLREFNAQLYVVQDREEQE